MRKLLIIATVLAVPGLASGAAILFDSQGFESPLYNLGTLPGQDLWVSDVYPPGFPNPGVIDDPTGAGMGQVVKIDCPGVESGNHSGAYRPAGPSVPGIVVIEWDQYRVDTGDNFWYYDHFLESGWRAYQWDQNGQASAQGHDFGVALTINTWQHVTYTFDTINQTVSVDVDGTSYTSPNPMTDPAIDGIDMRVASTWDFGYGAVLVDNLRISERDPGGGPGDVDGNGIVDGLDLTAVIAAFGTVEGDPLWNPAADLDGNGVIDGLDLTEVIANWTTAAAAAASEAGSAEALTSDTTPKRGRGNVNRGNGNAK